MGVKKLGHVGIYCQDLQKMRDFYRDVIGLQVSDETPSAVFMSSHPDDEHHEFALFQAQSPEQHTVVQQLSFSCESLEDIVNYYRRFKELGVRFRNVTSHGNAVGLYFFDPEGNVSEVYWTTPFKAHQPYGVAVDLRKPIDEILHEIEEDVKVYAATGHRDPASFEKQKEAFKEDGILV
jgi:catechol-2,3-dioxygenase